MYWLGPFLYGILMGFLMSVLLGVIFFMLIQAGIRHGYKKGFSIAAGVITGDIIFIILAIGFTGYISQFLTEHENQVSMLGGAVLVIMGAAAFMKRRELDTMEKPSRMKSTRDYFLKPFFINLLNPANAAWWLGLFSIPPALNYQTDQKIIFASGAVLTVFFTEVGVAAAASGLKKYIRPRTLKMVDTTVGVVLLLVGARLLIKALL